MDWTVANILFADVKGYSSLSDQQMKHFAEKIIPRISECIRDLEILHTNTWGDGIVLIATRISDVCEAAIMLRDLFKGLNWSRYNLPRLDVRISVHHGEYCAGFNTLTNRPDFCGSTVVTAARIEPVTPPGRIWITEEAAASLKRYIAREKTENHPEFFAVDSIGTIELPKRYGNMEIKCLRRHDEPAITAEEIDAIREQERLRLSAENREERLLFSDNYYIVVGIIVQNGSVLLVRREDKSEGLDWMFPSAKKWPTNDDRYIIEKEVMEETGIACDAKEVICVTQSHPVTKYKCVYIKLTPRDDLNIVNGDPEENECVEWVEIADAVTRIGGNLNSDVKAYLTRQARKPI